jgi:signal peptidase
MLWHIVKTSFKTIKHGLDDEQIKKEYDKEVATSPRVKIAYRIASTVLLVILFLVFCLSVFVQCAGDTVSGDTAIPKVALSGSMSYKNEKNTYLTENGLDDQFAMFDLIFTHKLPDEFDLELYDIVVYDYDGTLIIHRIIGIEEPNEKHPDCRYFLLRGDANRSNDEFPVLYSQMRAIYRGYSIPFVGSFFRFIQSPAGYLCIILILVALVGTPILEKKLWTIKIARLTEIGYIKPDEKDESTDEGGPSV